MTTGDSVGLVVFVMRCMAAAVIAYFLTIALGLPHPLWACIFALVVSQDDIAASVKTIGGRVLGTIIGVVVAVAVSLGVNRFGLDTVWQMALAVAICAVFAWRRPAIQVCLWTPPIILMTATPDEPIVNVGFYRGCEVIVGVIVGVSLHIAVEKIGAWARQAQSPRQAPGSNSGV
jgi:uncharacterized membrane protein YgaE (UPF0421/DUF939 family)